MYSWLLTLWDDSGEVDHWEGVPEMLVATEKYQHSRDEWGGILNIPIILNVNACTEPSSSNLLSSSAEIGHGQAAARATSPRDV